MFPGLTWLGWLTLAIAHVPVAVLLGCQARKFERRDGFRSDLLHDPTSRTDKPRRTAKFQRVRAA
jgi:hypothetical protein